ncbi:UNVERIFIED_CONTAM: hypothetical protein FKN15_062674 [Acipenser sinensis]
MVPHQGQCIALPSSNGPAAADQRTGPVGSRQPQRQRHLTLHFWTQLVTCSCCECLQCRRNRETESVESSSAWHRKQRANPREKKRERAEPRTTSGDRELPPTTDCVLDGCLHAFPESDHQIRLRAQHANPALCE